MPTAVYAVRAPKPPPPRRRRASARFASAFVAIAAGAGAAPGGSSSAAVPAAPPDAPVVRPEHPRIFFRAADIPVLRARARGPLASEWRRLKAGLETSWNGDAAKLIANADWSHEVIAAFALGTALEADAGARGRYKAKVLRLADAVLAEGTNGTDAEWRARVRALAYVYDWLYGDLSPGERERVRDGIALLYSKIRYSDAERVAGHSHYAAMSKVIALLAIWGQAAGKGDAFLAAEAVHENLVRDYRFYLGYLDAFRWIGTAEGPRDSGGGYYMHWNYGRMYLRYMLFLLQALKTATKNVDLFATERPWLSEVGYHVIYGLRPDFAYFPSGDGEKGMGNPRADVDPIIAFILAAAYKDGCYQDFGFRVLEWLSVPGKRAGDAGVMPWPILFADPSIPRKPIETLPACRAFPRAGNFVLRSNWAFRGNGNEASVPMPDSVVVLFEAMPWYLKNHHHRAFNHFTLFYKGPLAIDSGVYDAYESHHWRNYYTRTIAHNSVTVFMEGEVFESSGAKLLNDGGQELKRLGGRSDVQRFADIAAPEFQTGRVPAYEDADAYTLVVGQTGDATPAGFSAYRRGKVLEFTRYLVFLKKDWGWPRPGVVVFDRVTAGNKGCRKTWHLHTTEEPRIEGRLATVVRRGMAPLGHTGQMNAYAGKLFVETVYPERAEIAAVGGPGREFWVAGANVEPQTLATAAEPGAWRIEVTAPGADATEYFLHVLAPDDAEGSRAPPATRRIESAAMLGVLAGRQVLLFPKRMADVRRAEYSVEASGPLSHLVAGLARGAKYRAKQNGRAIFQEKTAAESGTVWFVSRGGGDFAIEAR